MTATNQPSKMTNASDIKTDEIKNAMNSLFKEHNENGIIKSASPARDDYDDLEEALMNNRFRKSAHSHILSLVKKYS